MEQELIPIQAEILGYEPTKVFLYVASIYALYDSIGRSHPDISKGNVTMPLVASIKTPDGLLWSVEIDRGDKNVTPPIDRIKGNLYGQQGRKIQCEFILTTRGLFISKEVEIGVDYLTVVHLISPVLIDFCNQCRLNLYSFVLQYCFHYLNQTHRLERLPSNIIKLAKKVLRADQITDFSNLVFGPRQNQPSTQVHSI